MKRTLGLLMVLAVSLSALAAKPAKDEDKDFENKDLTDRVGNWGMAGCGAGSVLMKGKKDKTSQIVAAITNATFFTNTFGASFGTSNCDPKQALTAAVARQNAELFISVNRTQLESDVARMGGESVVGLSEVMGCSAPSVVSSTLNAHYAELFKLSDAELSNRIVDTMASNPAAQCRYL